MAEWFLKGTKAVKWSLSDDQAEMSRFHTVIASL
jgi:hypothetical protein